MEIKDTSRTSIYNAQQCQTRFYQLQLSKPGYVPSRKKPGYLKEQVLLNTWHPYVNLHIFTFAQNHASTYLISFMG